MLHSKYHNIITHTTHCYKTIFNNISLFFIFHINFGFSTPALVGLAFVAAVGICLVVLGCALPTFNNYWPLFVLIFYFMSPIPTVISRRSSQSFDSSSNACAELAIFLTTGIIISAIGLPLVLAHAQVIQWGACALVLSGNIIVFITILGYFIVFSADEFDYNMWC